MLTRRDVLIVASVSCIYGLGDPEDYFNLVAQVKVGEIRNRSRLVRQLVDMQYDRNDLELSRAKFRVRGDVLELVPAYEEAAVRIQFFGDEVERIVQARPADRRNSGRPASSRHLPRQPLRNHQREAGTGCSWHS